MRFMVSLFFQFTSQSAKQEYGVSSAGLITIVQPAARAGPALRNIIELGKFHGVIKPQTPTGCRMTNARRFGTLTGRTSP